MQFDKPTSPADRVMGKPVVVAKGGAAVGSVDAAGGVRVPDESAQPDHPPADPATPTPPAT